MLYLSTNRKEKAAMTMKEITDGLKTLLVDNHYNPVTIQFYERE